MNQLSKFLLTTALLLSVHFSHAQDTITYFNKAMETVCCKDSASFYRVGLNDHGIYQDSIKDYYITGELLWEGYYPKWGGIGEFTGYFKDGKKRCTATFMNNEFDWINTWDANGIKTMKRGNGLCIDYHPYNMAISGQGNYKAGEREGYWVWNNLEGKKIAEGICGKGKTITAYNTWDDAGNKQLVTNGNGTNVRYYSNGELKYSEIWINNKREGKYSYYYENGTLLCAGVLKNDKKDGAWKWYFNNGVCNEESSYVEGILHGPLIVRASSGVIVCKGAFKYGNRSGYWEWYTEEGLTKGSFNYN